MSLKNKAAEGVRQFAWSSVIANLIKFGQLVVLANLLTPGDVGVFGMVVVVISLATLVADAGTANALIHRDRWSSVEQSSLQVFAIVTGVLLATLLWFSAPVIAWLYREPGVEPLLRLYVLVLPITMSGIIFQALLEKHMEFSRLAKLDVWSPAIGALVAIGTAMQDAGVYAFAWGALANALLRSVVVTWLAWPRWKPSGQFSVQSLRPYFHFGLPHAGQRIVNFVYGNVDQILIGAFLGAQALGFYSLAQQFIMMLSGKVNQIFSRVFFPVFAPIKQDVVRLRHGYLRMQEYTALINLPMLVGLAVVSPLLVPLLVGSVWMPATVLIQILAVVAVTRSIAGTVGPLLLVKGRTLLGLQWSLLVVVLQTLAMTIGVSTGSLVLSATANAVLSLALLPLNYLILVRPLLGSCLAGYLRVILPALAMALVMGVVVATIGHPVSHDDLGRGLLAWVVLLLEIAAGTAVYVALLWIRDRKQLVELYQMAMGRMKA